MNKHIKPQFDFLTDLKDTFKSPEEFYRKVCNMPELNYSKMHDLVVTQAVDANKIRSDQIREKLREAGFPIESEGELFNFLSTKCHICVNSNTKLMQLFVGNQLICQWYDTFDIQTEFDPQNPTTIKSTITYGKPPASS